MRLLFTFLFAICLTSHLPLRGQELKYPVSDIDPALLKNASIVIRRSEKIIEVQSLHSETITIHKVITILKEDGKEAAFQFVSYNNWSDVERFEGAIYDASGKLMTALDKRDISDESAISDGLLYSDERGKSMRPHLASFPCTVEYFIKQSFRKMLVYPTWMPQITFGVSVESARLEIRTGKGLMPRYKALRLPASVMVSGDGIQNKTWEVARLLAVDDEPLCPPFTELTPVIYLTPNTHEVKRYSGDFTSWKSYGEWCASLNESRDTLDADMYAKVFELTRDLSGTEEKVKTLYHYLQSTCRYVAVEVGLSYIQPEPAEKVARLGYGDCKGLVNYAKALLWAAGIPSWYTLVRSGNNAEPIQEDFPGNQFNHIILCVPLERDTVWLECTNMQMPFGFLGDFTDDRAVLVVTPQGGVLTRTPKYAREQNSCSRTTRLVIDSIGDATVCIRTHYQGLQFDNMMGLPNLDSDGRKAALRKHYDIPGITFTSVSITSSGDRLPVLEEKAEAMVKKYSPVSGTRMFIPLNRFLDASGALPKNDNRKLELVNNFAYVDTDTMVVEIPKGYRIENLPTNTELVTQFGKYRTEVKADGQMITLVRHLEMEKNHYPATDYNQFADFLRQVEKQDKTKVVLVK